ncbi:MAG: [FeFe] hydrogenase H-cluster radical SAM maturase HydE [Butyricicoccus porcorum]|nr:[FeFe] hydrogenase H-cluster radical SAM maturase HydE [Butyricicoccus porcorum]MDY4482914.1 [FeFe] hydrogenase H-cluster radical SAM maturase HydE [Butyricicoccus porcorum]
MNRLIDRLSAEHVLPRTDFVQLISAFAPETASYAAECARKTAQAVFGNKIYIRGLIELSNFCRNDCYYCGIRRSNRKAQRYRLEKEEILQCAAEGYALGFRTFVLQGGEDGYYTTERMADIVSSIKRQHPDCAVTLSVGEQTRETYQAYFDAGADRYLLRHETADEAHYSRLHPAELSGAHRKQCLRWLKEIGFQTGSGFMVGSPFQTAENLADDLLFLADLQPEMIGIGPFIPHHDTPFAQMPQGSVELTLFLLSLLRLMFPDVLLPATTALGTLDPVGREKGILAGANVVMPNLSPQAVRSKYMLYDNKLATGAESAQHIADLRARFAKIGYEIQIDRGDSPRVKTSN